MKILNYLTLLLVIIGAVNWGIIGLSGNNLVDMLFGYGSMLSRIIYILVGISGVYLLSFFPKIAAED